MKVYHQETHLKSDSQHSHLPAMTDYVLTQWAQTKSSFLKLLLLGDLSQHVELVLYFKYFLLCSLESHYSSKAKNSVCLNVKRYINDITACQSTTISN